VDLPRASSRRLAVLVCHRLVSLEGTPCALPDNGRRIISQTEPCKVSGCSKSRSILLSPELETGMSNKKSTDHANKLNVKTSPESMEAVASSLSVNAPGNDEPVPRWRQKKRHWNASAFESSFENAPVMESIYDPSFNEISRALRKVDVIDGRDHLEETRKYLSESRDYAKRRFDVSGRMRDLKRCVRLDAKIGFLNILLSDDILRACQRIRAARLVKAAS
jgi:hypothetical protein